LKKLRKNCQIRRSCSQLVHVLQLSFAICSLLSLFFSFRRGGAREGVDPLLNRAKASSASAAATVVGICPTCPLENLPNFAAKLSEVRKFDSNCLADSPTEPSSGQATPVFHLSA